MSNPEWGQYTIRLRSLHSWAYPSLHPSGVVHWVPEQRLNIEAVTGTFKLIDGCSLVLCSATPSVISAGMCHRNKINSTAWLYRDGPSHKIVSFTLHLHYITYVTKNAHQFQNAKLPLKSTYTVFCSPSCLHIFICQVDSLVSMYAMHYKTYLILFYYMFSH